MARSWTQAEASTPVLTSSLYLFTSKVLSYRMRLLLPLVLVRLLTVYDFGSYRQFFLSSYIGALFQIGLNQALFYLVPRDVRNAGSYFINSIIMNVIAFVIIFAVVGLGRDQAQWIPEDGRAP